MTASVNCQLALQNDFNVVVCRLLLLLVGDTAATIALEPQAAATATVATTTLTLKLAPKPVEHSLNIKIVARARQLLLLLLSGKRISNICEFEVKTLKTFEIAACRLSPKKARCQFKARCQALNWPQMRVLSQCDSIRPATTEALSHQQQQQLRQHYCWQQLPFINA